MSDSESTTPVAPGAASPTLPAGHNRTVSALSNGSALNSPFGTQGARLEVFTETQEQNYVIAAIAKDASSPMMAAKQE